MKAPDLKLCDLLGGSLFNEKHDLHQGRAGFPGAFDSWRDAYPRSLSLTVSPAERPGMDVQRW